MLGVKTHFDKLALLAYIAIMDPTSKDPLDGKTLEMILTELVAEFGFEELGLLIRIKCFNENPSIKSSLTFLRRTPWARAKVERMYLRMLRHKKKKASQ